MRVDIPEPDEIRLRPEDHDYLTVSEVADLLRIDEQQVRRQLRKGKLNAVRPGRDWRIPRTALAYALRHRASHQ